MNNAKWQSWKQLGDLPSTEAMRLYVRTLEEELPDWWTPAAAAAWEAQQRAAAEAPAEAAAEGAPAAAPSPAPAAPAAGLQTARASLNPVPPVKNRSVAEVVVEGSWVSPYIASDRRPPPRYEHATALVGSQLFVVGGNCKGRYLADSWALNLENLTWTCVAAAGKARAGAGAGAGEAAGGAAPGAPPGLPPPGLPPVAGHAAVGWNGNVVALGGHTQSKDLTAPLAVRLLDAASGAWSALPAAAAGGGEGPRQRGGHSGTLLGSKVWVFGGEDPRRKSLGELWTLDLGSLEWARPEVGGPAPSPRSAHSAVAYRGRYVLVFGGGSVATCYNDLHVLDTQTLEWSAPATEGAPPPPRAGHAAAVLGSTLYVVGGGNNAAGCADMFALDLSELGQGPLRWTLVGNTPPEAAIASEGLSLIAVPMAGCVVSFGGYNGRYHNAVHVYRPEGYLVVKPQAAQAAQGAQGGSPARAAANGGAAAHEPEEAPAAPAAPGGGGGGSPNGGGAAAAGLEAARREAAAAKEAVALEVSMMRRQLGSATAALAEAERGLEAAREALAAEQQRAVALEVEAAELRQRLEGMAELEREVARYRARAVEEARKPGGIWGYITGNDLAAPPPQ